MSVRRLAAALLLGPLLLASPASAEDESTRVVDSSARPVTITSIDPQVLVPDETLVVVAQVRNTGTAEIARPVVRMHVNRFRVSDREGIDQWTDLGPQDPAGSVVAVERLEDPLAPGAGRTVRFEVAGRDLGFLDLPDTWGPRGLAVSLADEAGAVVDVDRSFVLWQTTDVVPRTRVSLLVPLTGEAVDVPEEGARPAPRRGEATTDGEEEPETDQDDEEGTGTAAALRSGAAGGLVLAEDVAPLTSPQGRLGAVLAATARRAKVAWALDPSVVAASRESEQEEAREWAQGLLRALDGRDVFLLGWSDPDLSALARADAVGLAQAAGALSESTSLEVLGRTARTDLAWPAGGLADQRTLELLAAAGTRIAVGAPGVLAPVEQVGVSGRTTVHGERGSVLVLLPDTGLTSAFTRPEGSSLATVAQRLLAETAVIARESSTELRHLLVALPRDWHPDPVVVDAQLDALEAAPWVDLASLTALLGGVDPAVERRPLPPSSPSPGAAPERTVATLGRRLEAAEQFAPVLTDPRGFLRRQTAELLAPLSVAWRSDPSGREDLAHRVAGAVAARTAGLSVVEGSDVSFFAREGSVPVTVASTLADEARVLVELRPASGILVADEPVEAVVPPGEQTTVWVPVQSVANGDVGVEVALLSPQGHVVAPTSSFTMRVRADWEDVGTGVVAALLGLGLVAGIVRTVRRGKTGTRVDASEVPELAAEAGRPVRTMTERGPEEQEER